MFERSVANMPHLLASTLALWDLQMALLKVLAVAGGAAVGFLLGGWFVQFISRVLLRRKATRSGLVLTRLLSMTAAGMLVYLWAFGEGGFGGLGGAGGWWPFGGRGGGSNAATKVTGPTTPPAADQAAQEAKKPVDESATDKANTIQVRLLGGKQVTEQRFYLIENDQNPHTWLELVKLLGERRRVNPPPHVLEIVLFKDSVDRDNPAVTQLERWGKENGVTPKLAFPATNFSSVSGKEPAAK
jgi:hypothetical protein